MNKRLSLAGRVLAGALALAGLGYMGLLARGKMELGGASPDEQTLGRVADLNQRAMQQYCTGVVATPMGTWLVGRREGSIEGEASEFARHAPDLAASLQAPAPVLSRDKEFSFISRLGANGSFELVATVPDTACLRATPDGRSVFVLTGIDRPGGANGERAQTAIFRSDDQGRSWQVLKAGLFPQANWIAWSLAPYFYDSRSVWAWREHDEEPDEGTPAGAKPVASGLQHSADGGATVEDIAASGPLLVSRDEILKLTAPNANWGDSQGRHGDVRRHVVQLDANRAVLWVSQVFSYAVGEGIYLDHHVRVTSRAELRREGERWRMGNVQREHGVALEQVLDNRAGQVVAVLRDADGESPKIALLDKATLGWKLQGRLPSAFGPLGTSGLRGVYISHGALVANVMSRHEVPRWLYPWGRDAASVSADAVFYSTDWGRSWSKLAIEGYLGLLGIDVEKDRVYWARGNWYSSRDPAVLAYGLR